MQDLLAFCFHADIGDTAEEAGAPDTAELPYVQSERPSL